MKNLLAAVAGAAVLGSASLALAQYPAYAPPVAPPAPPPAAYGVYGYAQQPTGYTWWGSQDPRGTAGLHSAGTGGRAYPGGQKTN